MKFRSGLLFLLLGITALGTLSCNTGGLKNSASKQDQLRFFDYRIEELSNGLKVVWIPDASLPKAELVLMYQVGSYHDDPSRAGLNYLTAETLRQGPRRLTTERFNDLLDNLGASFAVSGGADFTTFSAEVLSTKIDQLVPIVVEVLTLPGFRKADFDRVRNENLTALLRIRDVPSQQVNMLFDEWIYQDSGYRHTPMGKYETLSKLQDPSLLVEQYQKFYGANNAILVVAGLWTKSQETLIRERFGQLPKSRVSRSDVGVQDHEKNPQKATTNRILYVKNNLAQADIRFGVRTVARSHPDFLKLRVASVPLGGVFASRLNQIIRGQMGLTYGAHSSVDGRREGGVFRLSSSTRPAQAEELLTQMLKQYKIFLDQGITQKELRSAQNLFRGQLPKSVESSGIFGATFLSALGVGLTEKQFLGILPEITSFRVKEINEAIKSLLDPNPTIVVMGPPELKKQTLFSDFQVIEIK